MVFTMVSLKLANLSQDKEASSSNLGRRALGNALSDAQSNAQQVYSAVLSQ